jgi:CubicO group peptidase (beta-lactamase class C family)
MTQREFVTGQAVSRRSVLGVLGVVPLAAGGLVAAAGPAYAGDSSGSGQIPAELRPGGEFDQFVAQLAAEDKFSGTVLLMHRDCRVLSRSYGMANKPLSIANGPDTIFALGSITKLFTAVAIAQLAQQGKVGFLEKVGTYLDGFPNDIAGTVTVHQLLTHTSGMGDYMQNDEFWAQAFEWDSVEKVWDGCMAFVRRGGLSFTAGSGHAYSNSGYHVLGAIVEKVSGQSYYDYVRNHIFRVAGMTSSDFYTTPQWRDDRRIAHPYSTQFSPERADAIAQHIFVGSPAGDSFSNAADLVRFTKALLGNKLLNPAYSQLILTPKVPIEPPPPPAGMPPLIPFETYAPLAVIASNQWVLGHNGAAPGVSTDLEWYPDSGWVTVLLSNYDLGMTGTVGPINSLARNLITQQ